MEIMISEALIQNSRHCRVVFNVAASELLEFACAYYDVERDHFTIEGVSKQGRRVLQGRLSDGVVSSRISWVYDRGLSWKNELDGMYPRYAFDDIKTIPDLARLGVPWLVIDEIAIRNGDRAKQSWQYN